MSTKPVVKWWPSVTDDPSPSETALHTRLLYNATNDHDQAITTLKAQVDAIAVAKAGTTNTGGTTTTVETSGVQSFNSETGAVQYFPSLGFVNNQAGVTAYTTQTADNGALIVLNDASPVAVTLNFTVASPWYTTISNQGAGLVTVTPSAGTINGGATLTIPTKTFSTIFFDGANWEASTVSGGSGVTSLNGETGAVSLVAGTNITVTPSGTNITIAATGTAAGVSSLNAETGALTLVAGTGITITPAGTNITVAATGGGSYSLGSAVTTANVTFGPGAGTGPSALVVAGLDGNHTISFTTGTAPSAGGVILTFAFTAPRGNTTYPVVTPTVIAVGTPILVVGGSTTIYQLTADPSASLTATHSYGWNISCP